MINKSSLLFVIIVTLFIWMNSLLTGNISSAQSNILVDIFYKPFSSFMDINTFTIIIRKMAHFTEYALLGVLLTIFYKKSNAKHFIILSFIQGLLTAIIDETIQLFVPGRAGQILDILIDFSGLTLGIVLIVIFIKIRKRDNN